MTLPDPSVSSASRRSQRSITLPELQQLARIRPARRFILSLGAGLLISVAIFLLLPLSQFLASSTEPQTVIRQIALTPPPVLPPPPTPPPPPPESELLPPPVDLQPSTTNISATAAAAPQLDIALSTGIGDALAGALGWGEFGTAATPPALQLQAELTTFALEELDQAPRRLNNPAVRYPNHLRRANVTGSVRLLVLVDEEGQVSVLEVISADHPDFIPPAREAAERFRYEPPTRQGRIVRTRFILPIRFQLR